MRDMMPRAHASRLRTATFCAALGLVGAVPSAVGAADRVASAIEDLTSVELAERVRGGATTVLVPIGGTEQHGAHLALGKHNARVRVLAERIAQRLGNALVAPVVAYVPEGAIDPPTSHMRFAGTLTIPEATFEQVLDATARSLRAHGFRDIVFLGDHGGYQAGEQNVARRLNREWLRDAARVHPLPEYYQAATKGFADWLRSRGYTDAEIGVHGGLADTALSLATVPAMVRTDRLAAAAGVPGVTGDPRRATAALGEAGVELIVTAATNAIRTSTRSRAP
jgi:creatinine amidohydrolase/Fe(II)-dependent formamide hydrolase-like protein